MQRLRALDETECYLRCYGWRGSEVTVRVLRGEDPAPPATPSVTAERIRLAFEAMIDAREPEAA
jgi:hypothetical protein